MFAVLGLSERKETKKISEKTSMIIERGRRETRNPAFILSIFMLLWREKLMEGYNWSCVALDL